MSVAELAAESLLERAARVLQQNGFAVRKESLPGTDDDWVLAEDDLFVIALTTSTVKDIGRVESHAVTALLERLAGHNTGGKAWDAYVVLMSDQVADDDDQADLQVIKHDTRGVRRLTAVGTEPSDLGVLSALSPFIALRAAAEGTVSDAFDDLKVQLGVHGIAPDLAERAVDAYKRDGDLRNV